MTLQAPTLLPQSRNMNPSDWTSELVLSVIERGTLPDWQLLFDAAKQSEEVVCRIRAVTAPPTGNVEPDSRGLNERWVWDLVNSCFPHAKRPAA